MTQRKGQHQILILDPWDLWALHEKQTWIWHGNHAGLRNVSEITVCEHVLLCHPQMEVKKKLYVSMIQNPGCLLWTKAHLKWTEAKWKTALWLDKLKFEFLFGKYGRCILWTNKESYHSGCNQHSFPKLIWGCISVCSLVIWKGTASASITRAWLCSTRVWVLACLYFRPSGTSWTEKYS